MSTYRCKITNGKNTKDAFLVALIEVPKFPDEKALSGIVREPLSAVIAATDDDDARTFLALDNDEKHCIGDALVEHGAGFGIWKYCEIFEA